MTALVVRVMFLGLAGMLAALLAGRGASAEKETVLSQPPPILIDPQSTHSLLIECIARGQQLGTATGFTIEHNGRPYLITNWHVVAGRNPDTNQPLSKTGAVPDELRVTYHAPERLGAWKTRSEPLYEPNGSTIRWREHPQGRSIDVIALPLAGDNQIKIYPLDLALADSDLAVQVAMAVSIIGYPFGLAVAGRWPIWKTGHVASDPDLDYGGRPMFVIDATTRGGMSGSPVIARFYGGYTLKGGSYAVGGTGTRFLGVYSGRIHGQAEIGMVWRPRVIQEILAAGGPR